MEPDIPTTYKAAVFESKDSELTITELPLEYPKHGEVLIKVLACGVCHSDVEVQKGNFRNDLWVSFFLLHRIPIYS
jgi:D-arabinose 1-dehydrogenase-like Zn-dependent alcohol dehydrogenase